MLELDTVYALNKNPLAKFYHHRDEAMIGANIELRHSTESNLSKDIK